MNIVDLAQRSKKLGLCMLFDLELLSEEVKKNNTTFNSIVLSFLCGHLILYYSYNQFTVVINIAPMPMLIACAQETWRAGRRDLASCRTEDRFFCRRPFHSALFSRLQPGALANTHRQHLAIMESRPTSGHHGEQGNVCRTEDIFSCNCLFNSVLFQRSCILASHGNSAPDDPAGPSVQFLLTSADRRWK